MAETHVQHMLTTIDNPYNPFTQYDEWFAYDFNEGHHTPGLLARMAYTSEELSEPDQEAALEAAMDDIIQDNLSGMHRKVSKENF